MRPRMISIGVIRETTKLTGIIESSLLACTDVRGKPSRIKDAEGEDDGAAGDGSVIEVVLDTHFFAFKELRMSFKIMSSGTRLPALMAPSASNPAGYQSDHFQQ